jgi:hypothetical protein
MADAAWIEEAPLVLPADTDPARWLATGALQDWCARGGQALQLQRTLELRANAATSRIDLEWLRVVREATRHGLRVNWALASDDPDIPELLAHLPTPTMSALSTADRRRWTERHVFGRLYWRHGCSFVQIRDRRGADAEKVLVTIDDPQQVAWIHELDMIKPLQGPASEAREFVDVLAEMGLVLIGESCALLLPYRMSIWPVPNHMV